MRYNWLCKKFEFQQAFCPYHILNIVMTPYISSSEHIAAQDGYFKGPAFKSIQYGDLSSDTVLSIWCAQWPKEAKYWPFRRREHGWPPTANIRKIVQNGCHVVY